MTLKQGRVVKKRKPKKPRVPQRQGEASASGHMPKPEADDDALKAAKQAGLYLKAKPGRPEELGVGREVNRAEENLTTQKPIKKGMVQLKKTRQKEIATLKKVKKG